MNVVLLVVLLGLSFFFLQTGYEFLALLTLVLAGMLFFVGSRKDESTSVKITEPFGPQGPIVVENKMPDIPSGINFKIKDNWKEYMGFEYSFFNWGNAWHNVGHFLYRLFFPQRKEKKDKH
ncbi:hypothetical protein HZC09_01600 [Candidatus Micrarchaeota archaeon]|nr:hypothetical protein [Candidatus Micrarchaeota archaeon]